jgi:hypothetical protein
MAMNPGPGCPDSEDRRELSDEAFAVTVRPIYEDELDEYLDELELDGQPGGLQAQQ